MTQIDQVKKHVATYGSINVLEAIGLYRITQLGRVVYELKDTGFCLKSIPCPELGKGFVKYVPDFHKSAANTTNVYLSDVKRAEDNLDAIAYLSLRHAEAVQGLANVNRAFKTRVFPTPPQVVIGG